MKKIILGCTNQTNIAALLYGEFILVQPKIQVINSIIQTNFDYLLNFEDNYFLNVPPDLIQQMGGPRLSKPYQATVLTALDILTPPLYADMNDNATFNQSILSNVNDDVPLFLKSNLGARGLGQTIVNRNTLEELTDTVYNNDIPKQEQIQSVEDKYMVGGDKISKEGTHRDYLVNTIKNGNYHFNIAQEVKEEYRIIGLYGMNPIIIKRHIEPYQWQANSGITQSGEYIKDSYYTDVFRGISDKLLDYNKTPWLSIDIYVTKSGEIGVFEFQMEMGYRYVPKKLLTNKVRVAVFKYIKKKFK
jgi:hypothetical protein